MKNYEDKVVAIKALWPISLVCIAIFLVIVTSTTQG